MPEAQTTSQYIEHPTSSMRSQVISPLFPSLSFTNVMSKVDSLATRVPWWLWFMGGVVASIAASRLRRTGLGNFFSVGSKPSAS